MRAADKATRAERRAEQVRRGQQPDPDSDEEAAEAERRRLEPQSHEHQTASPVVAKQLIKVRRQQ